MPETVITVPPDLPWIDIVREFDATPARVFQAHVDPALAMQWLGPRDIVSTVDEWDAVTGGRWSYTSRRGAESYRFFGSFHEIRPSERIVQTFTFAGVPDAVALEILTLTALPGGRCRLTSRSIGSWIEERDQLVASGMEQGILEGYRQLDELLAESPDVRHS